MKSDSEFQETMFFFMTENDEGVLQMLPSTSFGRFEKCNMFGRWFSDRRMSIGSMICVVFDFGV